MNHFMKKQGNCTAIFFCESEIVSKRSLTINKKNFDFQVKIANKMKDNASIISAAFMNDSEDAKKILTFW